MIILTEILILLCAVYIFSFWRWCLKHNKANIIGNISVFTLGLGLVATAAIIYTRVN